MLGPFYEVLRRRRARIVEEDLIQGTSTFSIDARLPVIESFGLADEVRVTRRSERCGRGVGRWPGCACGGGVMEDLLLVVASACVCVRDT